ncbi:unnamed protein product, partial [Coregonus sp. 'balchen']
MCIVWKTHHLTISQRKQPATGRTYDVANKENEMACVQDINVQVFKWQLKELWNQEPYLSSVPGSP